MPIAAAIVAITRLRRLRNGDASLRSDGMRTFGIALGNGFSDGRKWLVCLRLQRLADLFRSTGDGVESLSERYRDRLHS